MRYYLVLYLTGKFTDEIVHFCTPRYYQVGEMGTNADGRFRIVRFIK